MQYRMAHQLIYKLTKRFLEIEEQLKTINEFTSTFTFEEMRFSGFRRLFNEGDRVDFDYNHGGRLYHADGQGYIGMSKKKRSQIKIDCESVVEIDINASYLTIEKTSMPLVIYLEKLLRSGLPLVLVYRSSIGNGSKAT